MSPPSESWSSCASSLWHLAFDAPETMDRHVEVKLAHRRATGPHSTATGLACHLRHIIFEGKTAGFVRAQCASVEPNILVADFLRRIRPGCATQAASGPSCEWLLLRGYR